MQTNKFSSLIIITIVLCFLGFHGCTDLTRQKKSETMCISVTLSSVSYDDLGRVLVFTHDIDNTSLVFIKDFYNKSAKKRETKNEMKRYARSLDRYIGEQILVRFYENGVGDRIIIDITKDTY